jgi:hypothetical protein
MGSYSIAEKFSRSDGYSQVGSKPKVVTVELDWPVDEYPDLSHLDQFAGRDGEEGRYYREDQKRKSRFGIDWWMHGCIARATVAYRDGGCVRLQAFTSGGIWGLESDSDGGWDEFSGEQIADLRDHLEKFGIDMSDFAALAHEARKANPSP